MSDMPELNDRERFNLLFDAIAQTRELTNRNAEQIAQNGELIARNAEQIGDMREAIELQAAELDVTVSAFVANVDKLVEKIDLHFS